MTVRLQRTATVVIGDQMTRVLAPTGRLLTFAGEDAVTARVLLEAATVDVAPPPRDTRAARIAGALVEHGALVEVVRSSDEVRPPRGSPIRVLYGITSGPDAVRAAEFLYELVNDDRFEVQVALEGAAQTLVNPQGLRWLFGVPVHEGLVRGETALHSALGEWADVIAVLPASDEFARRVAAGRYTDLASAAIAASRGRVVLFTRGAADGGVVDALAEEGFQVVPGDATRAERVGVTPGELPDALAGLTEEGQLVAPKSQSLEPAARPTQRVLYGISGAIVGVCSSAWLESLGGFEVAVVATTAAAEMVALAGLQSAYGVADAPEPAGLASWADVAVVLPATAEFLCRAADGDRSDVIAAAVADAKRAIFVPSMNPRMWSRRAVQHAVDRLTANGSYVVLPGAGFRVTDPSGAPGIGGIGVPPSELATLLRMVARGWTRATGGG